METIIEIYSEKSDKAPFVKSYKNEEEAINDFLEYHQSHNTAFDGMEDDEIREEIHLLDIAEEYFGSWGRVREIPKEEATYGIDQI